jgi:hypothetical protein
MLNRLYFFLILLFLVFSSKAQVPDSPILTEPPDVDIVVPVTITLEWNNVDNASSYEVQISVNNNFTTLVNSNPVIVSDNFYQIPAGLLNNFTVYYWRVRALNFNGPGNFSAPRSFRTAGTPPQEINSLEEVVESYGAMNSLNPGQINSLTQKLDRALYFYNHNSIFLANLNLVLFKLRVYILMFSNFLNNTEGESLLYNANKILYLINGDSPAPEITIPVEFELRQNYPNPFNPSTTIEYTIPENGRVSLKVYDILGKEIASLVDKEQNAGTYIVIWDAKSFSSGVYFYRIVSGNYTDTKRMVLKK